LTELIKKIIAQQVTLFQKNLTMDWIY